MININGKLYKGNADYRIVKIDGEWKEIIVLTTDREINDYEQIRTMCKVYNIEKLIKEYKEENIKWLLIKDSYDDEEQLETLEMRVLNEQLSIELNDMQTETILNNIKTESENI